MPFGCCARTNMIAKQRPILAPVDQFDVHDIDRFELRHLPLGLNQIRMFALQNGR